MKRCVVCDSTEHNDTFANVGINNPITHWHIDKRDHSYICNRCDRSISNTLGHYTNYEVVVRDNEDNINEDPLDLIDVVDEDEEEWLIEKYHENSWDSEKD
jgi:hypothetical protein